MTQEIELTDIERAAKEHFLLHIREATFIPCDIDISSVEAKLPAWYDEVKYKRGQKYFYENRLGILNSNLAGLICLLAEPRGLRVLASTGRSSTVETARKRYLSTVMHTLTWYEYELTPGSKSWESINRVRKMHFLASKSSESKKIGKISQSEISFTAFGFMGFVLVRPHTLGIRYDNQEDRESFVHLWAVLLHMLGVQDKYNICLQPFKVVEITCQIFLRYILIPISQLETPEFKHMVTVMIDGLSPYLPNLTCEAQMFQTRRVVGIPGYQYGIDPKKEIHCRSLLTQSEVDECNELIFQITNSRYLQISVDIPIIDYNFISIETDDNIKELTGTYTSLNVEKDVESNLLPSETEYKTIDLILPDNIKVTYVNYENEWQKCLNDAKFYEMSSKGQRIVKLNIGMIPFYENFIGRYIVETIMSLILYWMKKALKNLKR